jgi:hypothetical protein
MLAQRVLFCSGKHLKLLSQGWEETGWLKNIDSFDWPETILVKKEKWLHLSRGLSRAPDMRASGPGFPLTGIEAVESSHNLNATNFKRKRRLNAVTIQRNRNSNPLRHNWG